MRDTGVLRNFRMSDVGLGSTEVWGSGIVVGGEIHQLSQQWRYKRDQGQWGYVFGRRDGTGGCIAVRKTIPNGVQDTWMVYAFSKHPSQYEGGLPDFDDEDGQAMVFTLRQDLTGLDIQVRRECHGREAALFPAIYAVREKLGESIIWLKS